MTIGVAATGPWAGAGILAGLRAVEAVGHGAIGGFVSLAVLTADQTLLRAETQNGGASGLFSEDPPERILRAPFAALISSGPNRPLPLSQFVAAAPGVGLVTGHRFPQALNTAGKPLNAIILGAMQSGTSPQQAIDDLITAEPGFDAGFIALSRAGVLGLANMPSVLERADQGAGFLQCTQTGAQVATLHNAIQPHGVIAAVAGEVALDEMRNRNTKIQAITVRAGVTLSFGDAPEIHVDAAFKAIRVAHPKTQNIKAETAFGIGDRVKVVQLGKHIGWLGQEPFMILRDGAILTLDGKPEIKLPVLIDATSDL